MGITLEHRQCEKETGKRGVMIWAPKPFWNLKVQAIIASPFVMLGIVNFRLASDLHEKMTIPLILVGCLLTFSVITYFIKNINSLLVSQEECLEIYKRGKIVNKLDLNHISTFVGKKIKPFLERPRYELALEEQNGNYIVLFMADPIYSKSQWDHFAEKVSVLTEKPSRKEIWLEDSEGKYSRVPFWEWSSSSKKGGQTLLLSNIAVSLLGAAIFSSLRTLRSFLFLGGTTILINIASYLFFSLRYRKTLLGDNKLTMVAVALSMAVPYATIYLAFCYIINGFSLARLIQ